MFYIIYKYVQQLIIYYNIVGCLFL